jgi:PEP-CTERM motif
MLKILLAGAALAACTAAQAEEKTFEIVYKGFYSVEFSEFQAYRELSVEITVDDLDNDGSYSLFELNRLKSEEIDYLNTCDPINCVEYFSWTPGTLPEYSASYQYNDGVSFQQTTIVSGVDHRVYVATFTGFEAEYTWQWTDATTTTITQISPVPEPAHYGMLAIGLAGIAALARRRRG